MYSLSKKASVLIISMISFIIMDVGLEMLGVNTIIDNISLHVLIYWMIMLILDNYRRSKKFRQLLIHLVNLLDF